MANNKEENKPVTPEKEKMVKIKIPKTRHEKDPVYVSVNMRDWLIQRGVEVEVPECVAEVLENKDIALEKAYEFEDANKTN